MNFNLLFSVVSALSFIIEFAVDNEERQDYFLFGGNNNSAQLFRENMTLYLHLTRNHGEMFSIYNCSIDDGSFQFSWNEFLVDEKKMTLQRSIGNVKKLEFEHFTFLSPLLDFSYLECSNEAIYSITDSVNYWYFLVMMIVVAIVFDSKPMAVNLIRRLVKNTEGDYITIDRSCGPTGPMKQQINNDESSV